MKIILVHNHFHITGGAEVFFFDTGKILQKYNNLVAYFSSQHKDNLPCEYSEFFVPRPRYTNSNIFKKIIDFPKMLYSPNKNKKFGQLLDNFQPDIIHCFNLFSILTPSILQEAKKRKLPVVVSLNDYKHICPNYKLFHHNKLCFDCMGHKYYHAVLNKCSHDSLGYSLASSIESYYNYFTRNLVENVDVFLFASNFMRNMTVKFWQDIEFKSRILKNPFESRKIIKSSEKKKHILFFGRLIEEKGVNILLHAASFDRTIQFIIIGDGPDSNKLKKLAGKLNLSNVEFIGPKWDDELNHYIRASRAVVVPSLWHENYPYVILQSFAHGIPVIGSNRGGIPELVLDGKRGFIYDATNPKMLSEKIRVIWSNDMLFNDISNNAKNFVDSTLNEDIFMNTLNNIYKDLLN